MPKHDAQPADSFDLLGVHNHENILPVLLTIPHELDITPDILAPIVAGTLPVGRRNPQIHPQVLLRSGIGQGPQVVLIEFLVGLEPKLLELQILLLLGHNGHFGSQPANPISLDDHGRLPLLDPIQHIPALLLVDPLIEELSQLLLIPAVLEPTLQGLELYGLVLGADLLRTVHFCGAFYTVRSGGLTRLTQLTLARHLLPGEELPGLQAVRRRWVWEVCVD